MAFTSNAWFIQDAFNPDRPELSAEKRVQRRATRDRWAANHLRQWEGDATSGEVCVFTGLPAAKRELSSKLAAGRIGRNQMPLLQGDDAINFFPGGDPGLPISPEALLALQFMPMGCAKCGVGLLAVHADDGDLTREFVRVFLEKNVHDITQAQIAGEDKLPGAHRSLKTLLVEQLTDIEQRRMDKERRTKRTASITAYNFNNGKSPQLVMYHLPLQITSFLRTVLTPSYQDAWQQIVQRGWQRIQAKPRKKGISAEALSPRYNYLYEDLFTLPRDAPRFIRTYFLRVPRRFRFEDDPRNDYSPRRERELISWPLVVLFLKEVMSMDEERIERIRILGDKLAEYTRHQGGKRFFREFFTEQKTPRFLTLLMKPSIWPDWMDHLKAKSEQYGGETLAEHTWDVLTKLAELRQLRPDLPALVGAPRLWHCLFWTCFLHDFGKAAQGFQARLAGGPRWRERHEVLSLAFLDWIAAGFSEKEQTWVLAAIVSHHRDAAYITCTYPDVSDDPLVPLLSELDDAKVVCLWRWVAECAVAWRDALGFTADAIAPLPW